MRARGRHLYPGRDARETSFTTTTSRKGFHMKSVEDLGDLRGKRVVIRCDFNVPLDGDKITDDGRIKAALPTLTQLHEAGARTTVLAHLGRPKGAVDPKYSLAPVAKRLGELMNLDVKLAGDVVGPSATKTSESLADGEIALVENVRFEKGETSKDEAERAELAQKYASFGEFYVSNGFGVVHRKQASVYDVAKLLPSAAGSLVAKEVEVLEGLTADPKRPFVVVLGGAKVADKLAVIDNLLKAADTLVIGGGMAYTFLKAKGLEVGDSLLDEDSIDACTKYLEQAKAAGKQILLPVDVRVVSDIDFEARTVGQIDVVPADEIPSDKMAVDIGPETEKAYANAIKGAKSVFWNGPMGVFEIKGLELGTKAVAQALTEVDGLSVVGGGDSASAVRTLGFADDQFGHISTGGGASLVQDLGEALKAAGYDSSKSEAVVIPPFTDIRPVAIIIDGDKLPIAYGAQDISAHDDGAYTGEVSGAMLSKLGCRYVVVGHSERREYHNESDELVNAKAKKVIENGMTPIICCGEALEVRKAGKHVEHTVGQIKADLDGISAEQVAKLVIAYEPIWAIGTGETATADDAQEVCQAIREAVKELYDAPTAEAVRIQYGGSVKPANVAEIMAKPDVDGALVGGASLKAGDFSKIVTFYEA